MNSRLKVYLGTEEGWEDYIYLDLCIGDSEYQLVRSEDSINDSSEQDFLDALTDIFSHAETVSQGLRLPIEFDRESFQEVFQDFSDSTKREVVRLVKGVTA